MAANKRLIAGVWLLLTYLLWWTVSFFFDLTKFMSMKLTS